METPTMRQLPALGKMQQAGIPVNSCDFPGSPAAETLCVQSRGPGLIPSHFLWLKQFTQRIPALLAPKAVVDARITDLRT